MKTDIEFLTLLEMDLQEVASREAWKQSAPSSRRRSSWTWATVAAGVIGLLVVAGLIGMLVTNGGLGSADDASTAGERAVGDKGALNYASATPAPSGVASGASGGGVAAPPTALEQTVPVTPPGEVSAIIRDGTMSIQVERDGFSDGFAAVTRVARNNGGFVLSSQIRGQRRGELTLRIPAKRFDEAMLALRAVGVVQAQSITGKDVTAQYVDLHARLENLVAQRTVLRGLMAQATTIQETITVQNRLSTVELQIEQIQGQLNVIDDQVSQATVRVELHEKDTAQLQQTAVENPSLGSAWDRSIQGFLNVVSAVVIGLGYLLPLAALGLIVWLITAAVRRRHAAS